MIFLENTTGGLLNESRHPQPCCLLQIWCFPPAQICSTCILLSCLCLCVYCVQSLCSSLFVRSLCIICDVISVLLFFYFLWPYLGFFLAIGIISTLDLKVLTYTSFLNCETACPNKFKCSGACFTKEVQQTLSFTLNPELTYPWVLELWVCGFFTADLS